MLTIIILNDGTGTPTIGNYNVKVRANRNVIWRGRVEGQRRHVPWTVLAEQVLCVARGVPRRTP